MKRVMLLLVLTFTLTGCAAHDAKINPLLNSMTRSEQAINAFGPPRQVSQMYDGSSVYVWGMSHSFTIGGFPVYQPNTQTHSGSIYSPSGRIAGAYSGTSYGGSVGYTPTYQVTNQCELRMIIEQNGYIRTWSYQGNACDRLIVNAEPLPAQLNFQEAKFQEESGNARGLNDCLDQTTKHLARENKDLDSLAAMATNECYEKTGGRIPNLSIYYARQALDSK